jgi:hypothetical protein
MCDGILTWEVRSFACVAFSTDSLFFCGVVGAGTVIIYHSICSENQEILSFDPLGSCFVPPNYYDELPDPFVACCVSSHLNLVCEASNQFIFTFHIASRAFIRRLVCDFPIKTLLISDSYNLIFAVGTHAMQVFTANGTPVANLDGIEEIVSSGVSPGDSVAVITGHATGKIREWTIDFAHDCFVEECVIEFGPNPVDFVAVIEMGLAVLAMDTTNVFQLFAAPGATPGLIIPESVACCAGCHKVSSSYIACPNCPFLYCEECMTAGHVGTCDFSVTRSM